MSKSEQYKKEIENLENKSLEELGNIVNLFGNKYKGKLIKEIYKENPGYFEWLKTLNNDNYIGNKYYFDIEYSKRAMIIYYDIMDYLKNVGK